MGKLKKILSLHQASQISGYHQDYLSSLIRKGEINGEKLGGNWFTTEEEIQNYIFKQKIRNKNLFIKYLLSFFRANSSFIYAFTFLLIFSVSIYFYNQQYSQNHTQAKNTDFVDTEQLVQRQDLTDIQF